MNVTNENRYWQDFIAGNREAFKVLYDGYADALFSYGCLYSRDRDLVKDCLHDLFVDLDRYRTGLNPDVNVRAYLLASLRRKLLAMQQKQPAYAVFMPQATSSPVVQPAIGLFRPAPLSMPLLILSRINGEEKWRYCSIRCWSLPPGQIESRFLLN
jgi:hypothetical protein